MTLSTLRSRLSELSGLHGLTDTNVLGVVVTGASVHFEVSQTELEVHLHHAHVRNAALEEENARLRSQLNPHSQ